MGLVEIYFYPGPPEKKQQHVFTIKLWVVANIPKKN